MSAQHSSGRASALTILQAPSVGAYIGANVLLYVGLSLQITTLAKQVYDITGREIDLGILGLAEFLPIALLVFVTGTVADRFNRKHVSQMAMGGELTCALLLMWYASTQPTSVVPIFFIAMLFGVSRGFLAPAMRPLAAVLAPAGGLPQMIAMYSAVWTVSGIVGPALSGFLYNSSPVLAYGVGSAIVSCAILLFSSIRLPVATAPREKPERVSLTTAVEGLRFVRRTPLLFAGISLDLFAVLLGGAMALLPVIAEERLGVGNIAYGWLRSSAGIGSGIVALILALRPLRRHIGRWLLLSVGVFGAGTIVLGLTRTYWVAFVAMLIIHGADMVSVFIRGALVPLVTPDDKRGRVSAVENVFIGATNELGAFKSGVSAQLLGVSIAVAGGGMLTVGVVVLWWFKYTRLRDIDRFDELTPA